MYRIHVYFVVILALYTGFAQCKPFCQCGLFSNCCAPSTSVYAIPYTIPLLGSPCPLVHNCASLNLTVPRPCHHQGHCNATEACCFNPCTGYPICQLRTDQSQIPAVVEKCPVISSCKEYEEKKRKQATGCKHDNDCLRKEKCCTNPCEDFKTCQEF